MFKSLLGGGLGRKRARVVSCRAGKNNGLNLSISDQQRDTLLLLLCSSDGTLNLRSRALGSVVHVKEPRGGFHKELGLVLS